MLEKIFEEGDSRDLIMFSLKNPPLSLQDNHLLPHIRKYGVVGENGLFAYIAEAIPEIMKPFKKSGLISQEEITALQERYEEVSRKTDFLELNNSFSKLIVPTFSKKELEKERKSKYIELAEKAEEHGVSPYEFLTEPEFEAEKKQWIKKSFQKSWIPDKLPKIRKSLEKVIDSEDIIESIEKELEGVKGKDYSKYILSYLRFRASKDPNLSEKIKDYARLGRDLDEKLSKKWP